MPGLPHPRRLLLGLVLVFVCWPLTWLLPGMRSHILFFPLWLGYILTVDALVELRRGSSLLSRSPRGFVSLFLVSVPVWWFFELLNRRLGNWEYVGSGNLTSMEYVFWASLSFSTVTPAVFESAELLASFGSERRSNSSRMSIRPLARTGLVVVGAGMLAALLRWPEVAYPLLWIFPMLLVDPLAHASGRPSLLRWLESGASRPFAVLAGGALLCGFFWELWNFYSYPKWAYHIPGVGFAHVFEMPILGYLGYLPFGLSLYSMSHLLLGHASSLRLGAASGG